MTPETIMTIARHAVEVTLMLAMPLLLAAQPVATAPLRRRAQRRRSSILEGGRMGSGW